MKIREESAIRFAVLGFLALQLCWIVALPPFRGIDEFDHVYRAAAVAHGQIVAGPVEATRGTGAWLRVPIGIVTAARDECERLEYTTDADCIPSEAREGMAKVASGAGRYYPLYYLAVGWITLWTGGDAAVLLMRLLTSFLCASLFFICLRSLKLASSGRWPLVGLLLSISPVAVYSGSIVAPNGVEIMAGLAVWSTLTAALRRPQLLAAGPILPCLVVASCLLAVLRQLGPLWLLLVVGLSVASFPTSSKSLFASLQSRRGFWACAGVLLAVMSSLSWTLFNRSLVIGRVEEGSVTYADLSSALPSLNMLWLLQSIAAFPTRNEQAPTTVYVCIALLWLGIMALAWRRGSRWQFGVALSIPLLASVMANLVTWATFLEFAASWQGRYALPLTVGAAVMAGWSLDIREVVTPKPKLVIPVSLIFAVGHSLSISNIMLGLDSSQEGLIPWTARVLIVTLFAGLAGMTMFAPVWLKTEEVPRAGRRLQMPTSVDVTAMEGTE